jgi:hypothetical protein
MFSAYNMQIPVTSRGGQMLTCAIRGSGARGLDLFLATGPDLNFSELRRRQVGQRCVCPRGWLRGR